MQEKELSAIERLWEDCQLPDLDGLYFPDGRSYEVALCADTASGVAFGEAFDLEEALTEDPDWVTDIGKLRSAPLPDGGELWAGEGISHGSYGFCGRLHADHSLAWVLFFEDSNPFTEIQVSANHAAFRSTSGVSITVDIDDPLHSHRS
ncbi:hypothetical protein [Streptomyces rimosus]|uniref:hypothetical protein n=1 Tax=Streptomyces rimosus TaxID=1927 RepID=UPI000A96214F|nr:hypothetical protein [Streptomyces rimosus]